jgi:hypothetical protein
MELKNELKRELDIIAKELTVELKSIIKRKGLYEKGKLFNSVEARVTFAPDGAKISIIAEDYYKYLDDKYQLTKTLFSSEVFKNIESSITSAFERWVESEL